MPGLGGVILISNLRLCGIPFLSGFYSKDIILEIMLIGELNVVIMAVALLATALTVIYSCRLTLGLFREESMRERYRGESDFDVVIAVRMGVLILPSIMGGWFLRGLIGSRVLVYLSSIQKLFILLIVLASGALVLGAAGVSFKSNSKLLNLLHQM